VLDTARRTRELLVLLSGHCCTLLLRLVLVEENCGRILGSVASENCGHTLGLVMALALALGKLPCTPGSAQGVSESCVHNHDFEDLVVLAPLAEENYVRIHDSGRSVSGNSAHTAALAHKTLRHVQARLAPESCSSFYSHIPVVGCHIDPQRHSAA
jgi:hypothetical protein